MVDIQNKTNQQAKIVQFIGKQLSDQVQFICLNAITVFIIQILTKMRLILFYMSTILSNLYFTLFAASRSKNFTFISKCLTSKTSKLPKYFFLSVFIGIFHSIISPRVLFKAKFSQIHTPSTHVEVDAYDTLLIIFLWYTRTLFSIFFLGLSN